MAPKPFRFSFKIDNQSAALLGAVIVLIALAGITIALSNNRQPWHPLQEISTNSLGNTTLDNYPTPPDKVIDFAQQQTAPGTLECQVIWNGTNNVACPSGWMLTSGAIHCASGATNAKIVPSLTLSSSTPTYPYNPNQLNLSQPYAFPYGVVNTKCSVGSPADAYAICCRMVSVCPDAPPATTARYCLNPSTVTPTPSCTTAYTYCYDQISCQSNGWAWCTDPYATPGSCNPSGTNCSICTSRTPWNCTCENSALPGCAPANACQGKGVWCDNISNNTCGTICEQSATACAQC